MKKTIAILLVAILAVSSVFAGFSGKASIGFGGNLDNGNFGFIDKSAKVNFDIDLATATAEQIADGDVYASIKATFGLKLLTGEKKYADGDPYADFNGFFALRGNEDASVGPFNLAVIADITEAKVAGENWYVSILGLSDAPNFAESAIDTYTVEDGYDKYGMPREDFDKAYNYGVGFEKAPGVEVGVFDYVFGVGLLGDYDDDKDAEITDKLDFSLYAKTPEYNLSGVILQAGAVYSYAGDPDETKVKNQIGLSGKVGFENDTITASLATDIGFNLEADKFKDAVDMDLAANFGWNFITVDVYYATIAKSGETPTPHGIKNYGTPDATPATKYDWDATEASNTEDVLSLQAKFDLNAMDVPVAITASVKDVLNTVELGVKAEVTAIENLKITASAGYVVNTVDAYDKDLNDMAKDDDIFMGQWKFGADVEYDFGFAKVAAGVSAKNLGFADAFDKDGNDYVLASDVTVDKDAEYKDYINKVVLGASASVSTDQIIPGAELKLAWENADDLLKVYKYNDAAEKYNFGKITASCSISF